MNDLALTGLEFAHRIAILALSLGLLALVLELVRRGMLKERYALVWLITAGGGLAIGIAPGLIVAIADLFHFQYLTVIFAIYFFFSFGLVLNFSIVISQLYERNRALTQEVALLAHALERLENERAH
jgi:MFS family permease